MKKIAIINIEVSQMNIRFDEEKLSKLMRDFYNATGINITIIDENGIIILKDHKIINEFCACIQRNNLRLCLDSDLLLIEKCRNEHKSIL
jgi:ligand-binding sensor protein